MLTNGGPGHPTVVTAARRDNIKREPIDRSSGDVDLDDLFRLSVFLNRAVRQAGHNLAVVLHSSYIREWNPNDDFRRS